MRSTSAARARVAPVPPLPRLRIEDSPTHAMSPATGFYSTAEDLCRYARAHYVGNEELLSDASKRAKGGAFGLCGGGSAGIAIWALRAN